MKKAKWLQLGLGVLLTGLVACGQEKDNNVANKGNIFANKDNNVANEDNIVANKSGSIKVYKLWLKKPAAKVGTCATSVTQTDTGVQPQLAKIFKLSRDAYRLELPGSNILTSALAGEKSNTEYKFYNLISAWENTLDSNLKTVVTEEVTFGPEEKDDWTIVKGTLKTSTVDTCSGAACDLDLMDCTQTIGFTGLELTDIDFVISP